MKNKLYPVLLVFLLISCGEREEDAISSVETQELEAAGLTLNVIDRLDTIFELTNGNAQQTMVALATRLFEADGGDFILINTQISAEDQTERKLFECAAGGTLETWDSVPVESYIRFHALAYDCLVGPLSIRGSFTMDMPTQADGDGSFKSFVATSYNLRDSRNDSLTTWDSGGVRYVFNLAEPDQLFATNWGADYLKVRRPDRSFNVDGPLSRAYFNFNRLEFRAEYQGIYDDSGEAAEIGTVIPFTRASRDEFEPFTLGTMTYVAAGTSLLINADTGNDETFLLTVNEDDATLTHELSWSERFRIQAPNSPGTVDLGF